MNPTKNRKKGKRTQKKIANILNGLDIGILGGADILHETFIIETKHRKTFVGETFLKEAETYAKKFPNKTPIAIVHTHNKKYIDSIVCIRLKDLLKLLNHEGLGEKKI